MLKRVASCDIPLVEGSTQPTPFSQAIPSFTTL